MLRQHFTLASHATLEWLPQDTILFPGANAAIQTVFHLTSASRLLAWDLLCLGRPVMQETFSHGMLQNRLEVWRDGLPLLIERLILQEGNLSGVAHHPWVLSGQRTHAGGHAGAAYGAWRLRRGNA